MFRKKNFVSRKYKWLTKEGRMARKAGVCCEAGAAAGAAAGQAEASPRTLTPPPHVQLPSAVKTTLNFLHLTNAFKITLLKNIKNVHMATLQLSFDL